MRNKSREAFRNEWKYLISTSEKEMLMTQAEAIFYSRIPMPGKGDIISAVCILRITGTVHTRKRKPGY
mgnify:CR=1 FL=1